MSVFHAEAGQEHLGIAVGPIIAIAVRIEEQVRDLNNERTSITKCQTAGQVEPGYEITRAIGPAIATPMVPISTTRRTACG